MGNALFVVGCASTRVGSIVEVQAVDEAPIRSLNLKAIDGQRYALADMTGNSAIVLAWTGVGCPMAKVYLPRVKAIAAQFKASGVQFFLIDSNPQDSWQELSAIAKDHELGFPIIHDRGGTLAHRLGAQRTTEVIILDRQRRIAYRGAVDNQYGYQSGEAGSTTGTVSTYRRAKPSEHFLRDALNDILAGRQVVRAETDPMGCAIGSNWDAEALEDARELTFHEDIEPLLQRNCQTCHRTGGSAPFSLTEYRKASGWADTIREVVSERRMPPWNADPEIGTFKNDRRLSRAEIDKLVRWVDQGAQRGDPADAPEPLTWPEGWDIGEPDLIVTTPAFEVPAEGTVPYRYVTVPVNLTEDRWVQAAQVQSTGSESVHHVLVFVKEQLASRLRQDRPWSPRWSLNTLFGHLPPRESIRHQIRLAKYVGDLFNNGGGGLFGYFIAVLPGESPTVFPQGQAQFLPAGATLRFQIHYQPTGKEMMSETSLALRFSKEPPKHVREVWAATSVTFEIPPGSPDHVEHAKHRFQRGGVLLSLKPHMHVRGKSVRYVLERRDGTKETLLNVPDYDFDWQHTYELAKPKRVEKGDVLRLIVTFDNSEDNPYNPDPTRMVTFGLQTDEEMLIGYFEVIWDQRQPFQQSGSQAGK
jgi:peroxiredoxin